MTYLNWTNRPSFPRSTFFLFLSIAILVTAIVTLTGRSALSQVSAVPLINPANTSLTFVPNAGQTNPAVYYQTHLPGRSLFFTLDGLTISYAGNEENPGSSLALAFIGANPNPAVSASNAQTGVINYMLGNDPAEWQTGLPTFGRITYDQLYPDISLSYEGQGDSLSAVFQIEAGTDPSQIGWQFAGATAELDESGGLQLNVAGAITTLSRPHAWQKINGETIPISAAFSLAENGRVGLELGELEGKSPVALGVLLYAVQASNYPPNEAINDIAIDANGRMYVVGYTGSTIFPLQNPYQSDRIGYTDAFVTVFAPDGQSLIYSTLIGGNSSESATAIAVDDNGRIIVLGTTWSADFPTINPYQPMSGDFSDAFLTVFTPDGQSLEFSTYLGGTSYDSGRDMVIDENGRIYVTGHTRSPNFPLFNPFQSTYGGGGYQGDAFVTTFAPDGQTLIYSTYLGGSENEIASGIAVDGNGSVYLAGATYSGDFPLASPFQAVIGGYQDTYVTIFAPDGQSLLTSTYLGGSDNDNATSIAVDELGQIYLTGQTLSPNFPLANPYQPNYNGGVNGDAFVTVFAPNGQALNFSTYLGGNWSEWSGGIALNSSGNVYVTGSTRSRNFPMVIPNPAPYPPALESIEVFVTSLQPDGQSLDFSAFLGGGGTEYSSNILVDENNRAIIVGRTRSSDFPVVNPYQPYYGGYDDGFISIFAPDGQSLEYSTYFHGRNPAYPTNVELSEIKGSSEGTADYIWLALGLLALFIAGVLITKIRLFWNAQQTNRNGR